MAIQDKKVYKGLGQHPYNFRAALQRRKNALAALELQMESGVRTDGEVLSEKDLERIKAQMEVLQQRIKAGEQLVDLTKDKEYRTARKYRRKQKLYPRKQEEVKEAKAGEKVEVDRYKNQWIDCYKMSPNHMSKKKKKEARRQGTKQETGKEKVNKGWIKTLSISIPMSDGLARVKAGKHPNFRFNPEDPRVRVCIQTRDGNTMPYPVKKG